MAEEHTQQNTVGAIVTTQAAQTTENTAASKGGAPLDARQRRSRSDMPRERRGRKPGREQKVRSEFDQKIIDIRRVTRVVSGGRRFSFSVALVLGDRKGSVGVGLGKAGDTSLAIDKAVKDAKKHLVKVPVTKSMSIPFEVTAKYSSSVIEIGPNPGRGVVAGSSARTVIELAGLKDIGAKLRSGSKNKLNNAQVAVAALRKLRPHRKAKSLPATEKAVV